MHQPCFHTDVGKSGKVCLDQIGEGLLPFSIAQLLIGESAIVMGMEASSDKLSAQNIRCLRKEGFVHALICQLGRVSKRCGQKTKTSWSPRMRRLAGREEGGGTYESICLLDLLPFHSYPYA
jgi:hypothetical protein